MGGGLGTVLEDLYEAEVDLHLELERVSERHRADAEVAGGLRALSCWSERHVANLAAAGRRCGLALGTPHPSSRPQPVGQRSANAVGLADDLRQVFGDASLVQLDWELLAEVARAQQNRDLLGLAERSIVETQRLLTWVESRLKESVIHAITQP
jgi:hypothetical protein